MKTVSKFFNTIRQAENFQNRLYDKYDHVKLKIFPLYTQAGVYQWEVDGLIKKQKNETK